MRDNIKPIEAGFFKYCMKNLSHEYCNGCYAVIRNDRLMWDLIRDYSKTNNIPIKVIIHIVDKWDSKGIFKWCGDIWYAFNPLNFPLEYIMLIPRRALRKVPAFGRVMITTKAPGYNAVFTFKTEANGLKDVDAINETRQDYWASFKYNPEKCKNALRYISKMVDGVMPYNKTLLVAYIRYVMNSYDINNFKDDSSTINGIIRILKKFIKFANENGTVKRDMYFASYDNFIGKVSDFVDKIFKEINC